MVRMTTWIETEAEVEFEIDELVNELKPSEIKELISELKSAGHLSRFTPVVGSGYADEKWTETLEKLERNRLSLTMEEIDLIEKIASRFI